MQVPGVSRDRASSSGSSSATSGASSQAGSSSSGAVPTLQEMKQLEKQQERQNDRQGPQAAPVLTQEPKLRKRVEPQFPADMRKNGDHGTVIVDITIGVDGKVTMVSVNGDTNALDARDAEVNKEAAAIKAFTSSHDGPASVKANEKFTLTFKVQLASWLNYSPTQPKEFAITVPKDFKCDATTLKGEQLKIDKNTLTAAVTCSAPHGNYQAVGKIRFGYRTQAGASGLGDDGAKWDIKVD